MKNSKEKTEITEYIQATSYNNKMFPWKRSELSTSVKAGRAYYNLPVAFDIETSSFEEDGEPRACMYAWQMCFGDLETMGKRLIVIGRTWREWLEFIEKIQIILKLGERYILIYCHNLSFEFQWINTYFSWQDVFAIAPREPLYARTWDGLEFRCSLKLSGYRLETLAKNLTKHNYKKLVGNLDYRKIRHSRTPLTDKEIQYNIADAVIVCAYISERLEIAGGNITKIPYTKTGYVRESCRNACYGEDHTKPKYFKYRKVIKKLTITPHEYGALRGGFMGGYVHANSFYVKQILRNMWSYDYSSDYPFCLFANEYPWSKGELCYPSKSELLEKLNMYAWVINIDFFGLESKVIQDDFISISKCLEKQDYTVNNGRVNRAGHINITVTSIDLQIILATYDILDGWRVNYAYKYYKSYLPTDFIKCMLQFYSDKTTLKGVEGKEAEYMNAKEQLNSFYGCQVQNPLHDKIKFTKQGWKPIHYGDGQDDLDVAEGIRKYNKARGRFSYYPVGVFCTAYARARLWLGGIIPVGADYVYSDTDSIKILNGDIHKKHFDDYNNKVIDKLERACDYHGIPFEMVAPKTIKGEEKILGVWDLESTTPGAPTYSRFKTLGAKRYMTEDYTTHEISLTVSGLNKKVAIPYLLDKYGRDGIFDAFDFDDETLTGLVVPKGYSGRMISSYLDFPTSGNVTDYMGNTSDYYEKSSVNLSDSEYSLKLSDDYIKFLFGITKEKSEVLL